MPLKMRKPLLLLTLASILILAVVGATYHSTTVLIEKTIADHQQGIADERRPGPARRSDLVGQLGDRLGNRQVAFAALNFGGGIGPKIGRIAGLREAGKGLPAAPVEAEIEHGRFQLRFVDQRRP